MTGWGHLFCLVCSVGLAVAAVTCDRTAFDGPWSLGLYGLDFAFCWICAYALVMTAAAATIASTRIPPVRVRS